jgi:TRAP-type transport system small permease protein
MPSAKRAEEGAAAGAATGRRVGHVIARIVDGYHALLCTLVALLVAALLVPVTLQIVSRYTDLIPTWMWTEEAARFCLVWAIMLGATVAVRGRLHFDIDVLPQPKSARGRAAARIVVDGAIALFGIVFLWVGAQYALAARSELSEITELPMIWMYAAFPLAAAGWLLFAAEQIVQQARAPGGH